MMIVLMVLFVSINPLSVYGNDRTYISDVYGNPTNNNEQWRFITIVKGTVWTNFKVIDGQHQKGTKLNKGDGMFYFSEGGSPESICVLVTVGDPRINASISLTVPLGTVNKESYGVYKKATSKGYYLMEARKQVRPNIMFIQYRYKSNGKWGEWGKATLYSKRYEVIRVEPRLKKV